MLERSTSGRAFCLSERLGAIVVYIADGLLTGKILVANKVTNKLPTIVHQSDSGFVELARETERTF